MSTELHIGTLASESRDRRVLRSRAEQPTSRFSHYVARPFLQLGPILFGATIIAILALAWAEREEGHITAETGVGYWLGILGAVIMLMLVAYPLRKRFRAFHALGRVAGWFRLHMILGIIGPTLIILHTNFKLGSLNSRLALFTMLIVVASGIVGRYLYAKIHKGLYGKQVALRDILADIMALQQVFGEELVLDDAIVHELERYVPKGGVASRSLLGSLVSASLIGSRTRGSYRRVRRAVKRYLASGAEGRFATRRERRTKLKEIDQQLRVYFAAVKKATRLTLFERLFGMWHHLHMPLFILLALTVVFHIVAVHRY